MSASLEQAAAFFRKGDGGRAHQLVSEVLSKEPLNGEAWHMRGLIALHANRPAEAVQDLTRAASLQAREAAVHINLGAALNAVGRMDDALQSLTKALTLAPNSPEATFQIGLCHMQSDRRPEAIAAFSRATQLKPGWTVPIEMEANVLFMHGQHEKAFETAMRALAIEPNRALCHRIIADCLARWQRYDEAYERYQTAVALMPNEGTIRTNHALLLMRMGREEEGLREYAVAHKLQPNSAQLREGYAFALLGLGHFAEGWLHYAARDKGNTSTFALRKGAPPPVDIAGVKGKPVLAWLNQGIGDQIMFSSLIPDLIAAGADLTVECDPRLVPVLKRSFPTISARPAVETLPAPGDERFAYQVFLPDTARWLRTSFDDFPRQPGYLKADAALTAKLREAYRAYTPGRPVIGISWRTATNAKVSQQKSLQLADWGPLLTGRDAVFVKLQYGSLKQEVADASRELDVTIIDDPTVDAIADIDAFAAQVAAMDLVITTSNATAHMAGSLNVPVWTLVPKGFGGMWHWFRNRNDSPWYPSLRLFRQSERSAWGPVLHEAATALTSYLASWKA